MSEHGLDPCNVHAALLQSLSLLRKCILGLPLCAFTQRLQYIAGRSDGAGYDDGPFGGIGYCARDFCRGNIDFTDPILDTMQLESVSIGTETVRQDNVCARLNKALVDRANTIRLLDTPSFAGGTIGQPQVEQICSHGAVGHDNFFLIQ